MEAKQTLYVSNLNTRLNKRLLKQHLYHLFGIYGQIIDIVALKTPKMRGQAFVVYKEVRMALAAMQALQNFEFHHKPLMIAFAKTRSNKAIEWDKYVMGPAREMARKQAMEMTGRRQAMEQTFGQNIMPAHMLHPHGDCRELHLGMVAAEVGQPVDIGSAAREPQRFHSSHFRWYDEARRPRALYHDRVRSRADCDHGNIRRLFLEPPR